MQFSQHTTKLINNIKIIQDGKKVYEKVMKEYNQNFTVMRVFDALLQGKIERGELKL